MFKTVLRMSDIRFVRALGDIEKSQTDFRTDFCDYSTISKKARVTVHFRLVLLLRKKLKMYVSLMWTAKMPKGKITCRRGGHNKKPVCVERFLGGILTLTTCTVFQFVVNS